jgi:hypothetical protein
MTALEGLLRLIAKPQVQTEREYVGIVVDGFHVDPVTGEVAGPYLCIEQNDYLKQPLFIYNRSVRFEDLVWRCRVPPAHRARVLELFGLLEQIWEAHKDEFPRKYFLTQRLLLQEICKICGCTCSVKGRPIRDKRRYKKQMIILCGLLRIFVNDKSVRCPLTSDLASKLNSTISDLALRFHLPEGPLHGTQPSSTSAPQILRPPFALK